MIEPMDILMKEMVKYCKVAQVQSWLSLKKCNEALRQCAIARAHLDKLRENHRQATTQLISFDTAVRDIRKLISKAEKGEL